MKKNTVLIIVAIVALLILPRLFSGLFNLIGIVLVLGLLAVLFKPKLRKRLTKLWKIYNGTKRK